MCDWLKVTWKASMAETWTQTCWELGSIQIFCINNDNNGMISCIEYWIHMMEDLLWSGIFQILPREADWTTSDQEHFSPFNIWLVVFTWFLFPLHSFAIISDIFMDLESWKLVCRVTHIRHIEITCNYNNILINYIKPTVLKLQIPIGCKN